MKRVIYVVCLVVLLSSCNLGPSNEQWVLVSVVNTEYNNDSWVITVSHNNNLYDFFSTEEITDSCWVFFCDGEILDARA